MLLLIDNYDSFTYNLVQYLGELGSDVEVVRNDRATVADLLDRGAERLVISPGPCTPADAGISIEASRAFPEAGVPTLGVCLGHQAMVEAFVGRVIRGEPVHGKDAEVEHDCTGIFAGSFTVTATYGDVVMGVRHNELPAVGVQFHPESILTPDGKGLLANFLGAH